MYMNGKNTLQIFANKAGLVRANTKMLQIKSVHLQMLSWGGDQLKVNEFSFVWSTENVADDDDVDLNQIYPICSGPLNLHLINVESQMKSERDQRRPH